MLRARPRVRFFFCDPDSIPNYPVSLIRQGVEALGCAAVAWGLSAKLKRLGKMEADAESCLIAGGVCGTLLGCVCETERELGEMRL